jgi:flagellar motor switch protein FliN/FliY
MNKIATTELEAAPQVIALSELPAAETAGASLLNGKLDVVQNVKVSLRVVAGEASISIGELFAVKADQVLTLDRSLEEPLDILLDGHVVARGQLVAVDDNFGIRILEVPSGSAP